MKRLFLLSTLLLIAFMAQAQSLKVSPKMKKGDVKTYLSVVETGVAGTNVKITSETQYTVTEESASGYVVEINMTDCSSDAKADNIMGRLLTASTEIMKNVKISVDTDKDGQVKGIRNMDEVSKTLAKASEKLIDELLDAIPQAADMMPKEVLMQQIMGEMTEANLVKGFLVSPMALNGKTIMTGGQDEYTSAQNMKMKRMYFLNGKDKITTTAKLDMTNEDMKQMIIEKVSEMAPDQAEMIKQNIDAVMASGMLKLQAEEKANYEMGDNGWVKSIQYEGQTEIMGQKINGNATITLK
jgi:hypothetical protein